MPSPPSTSEFGRWTAVDVLAQDKVRRTIAAQAGISESHFSNLMSGKRWPTRQITIAIAKALDVPPSMIERRLGEIEQAS